MYELAVCSDGMTEAQPRSFRQNRPASEYIIWHNALSPDPANRCSGCSNTCTWIRKKCRLITLIAAALTGQVQVLVTLTTKHDWARMDPQVSQAQLCYKKKKIFQQETPSAGSPLHSGGPQKLYWLAGFGVHQLRALAPVVLLWTPSCILSRMPGSLSWITTGRYLG